MIIKRQLVFLCLVALGLTIQSCSKETDPKSTSIDNSEWLIAKNLVLDGGPGKDGIPSIDNPKHTKASDVNFLNSEDLVEVYINGFNVVAYPHDILDWHEIVNDKVGGKAISVTYCPLTGTGIAWNRTINGNETTFGVSGLLYNTNLMPFDRESNSTWSQIRQECVNGSLIETRAEQLPLLEMEFGDLKTHFPNANVLNKDTGFDRSYGSYPYGDYITNNDRLIFPVNFEDNKLPKKERVLAIPVSEIAVQIVSFDILESNNNVMVTTIDTKTVLIYGEKDKNFMNAVIINDSDADKYTYNKSKYPYIISHENGNSFDIFGRSTSSEADLEVKDNYIGYFFSFPAFFDKVIIL